MLWGGVWKKKKRGGKHWGVDGGVDLVLSFPFRLLFGDPRLLPLVTPQTVELNWGTIVSKKKGGRQSGKDPMDQTAYSYIMLLLLLRLLDPVVTSLFTL